jgi:hypothetical protein
VYAPVTVQRGKVPLCRNYVSGVKKGQTQNKIHRKQNTGNLKKGADIDNRFSRNRRG